LFAHKHYVPILKCKAGDLWSLGNLKPATTAMVTPLVEIVPPSQNQSEQQRLQQSAARILQWWGTKTLFVDLIWRQAALQLPGGPHVVTEFFDLARAQGVVAIPVTALDRDPAFQAAVAGVIAQDNRGVAVRLAAQFFNNPPNLSAALAGLLAVLKTTRNQVDLIVDFGSIGQAASGLLPVMINAAIGLIPNINDWRTLTVASGSFPASVTVLSQSTWNTLPRTEWTSWHSVVTGAVSPTRLPAYADFTVGDPALPYAGPSRAAVNLRYSAGNDFFVWRGFAFNTHASGIGQIFTICSNLVGLPQFAGAAFSAGDTEIQARSAMIGSPGNPEAWRKWATNHYLELVVSQIATLP
jgi:hypothetical protein